MIALTERYRTRHGGWNVKHGYAWYRRDGGVRSYSWVKTHLQAAKLVPEVKQRGVHRQRRERAPLPGMLLHQDGSIHEWVARRRCDLMVTMDMPPASTLCEQFERTLGADNGVRFEGLALQVPADRHPCHYVKAKVRVHRYANRHLAIFPGPRKLVDYDPHGKLLCPTQVPSRYSAA